MRELAYTNISEIEVAKLAQSKSKNDEVLNFARQMIDDHTKALDQLQQLAQQKGVQLPTEPDSKHKALAKRLGAMSGDAFDREYLSKAGLSDHSQAHKLVARVKAHAHDADLKQLATNLQPGIDHHLQMAKELKSGAATSTGSSSGTSTGK
jgi:putative membrane protein